MVINRQRLGSILAVTVLLSLVVNFFAYRVTVWLLCPEPDVTLACFDTLRPGMSEDDARAAVGRPLMFFRLGNRLRAPRVFLRDHELKFAGDEVQIVLVVKGGVLSDGRASVNGQVVREHLQPREPVLDTIRAGLCRLERS